MKPYVQHYYPATVAIMKRYSPKRLLWLSLGLVCFTLGAIGLFLPLLPTTSFMLVAAFAFARSSPRLHTWLLQHKVFGPLITDWQTHRAISTKAKIASLLSMIIIVAIGFAFQLPLWVIGLQVFILGLVSLFLWTRPVPPT
ncbi:YbaN family protein [Fretibacter rubidus]|uniref:YbaN family protein n=1 Tax=Fretibacter rubidus TaxID=570162 RepID=UPI00352A9933